MRVMQTRRILISIAIVATALAVGTAAFSFRGAAAPHGRLIVIGMDGMDPVLCERMMDAGELPNFAKLRSAGGYRRLGTSIPPQSPVAWSNFITGADPGVHGIFDFIHRDPTKQFSPYYSAAETVESEDGWEVDECKIPLTFWPFEHQPTQTLLKRAGTPFWDYLDKAGVPVRLYDIPANYPPSPSTHGHQCCLSGMGVPDLLGTYGTYQYFSEMTITAREEPGGGGMRSPLVFHGNKATAVLIGPDNTVCPTSANSPSKSALRPSASAVSFDVFRHPEEPAARIQLQDTTILLKEGEWSEWVRVSFNMAMPVFLPQSSAPGICRFYLKQVRPEFRLYVTPINIDPSDTGGQVVSEPPEFVTELADALGLFHTAGFQEDHKALSNDVFTDEEYHRQADSVLQERRRLFNHAMTSFEDGLLFFYFSSTDLQAHMFWWDSDQKHPLRETEKARKYQGVIEDLYRRMDAELGEVIEKYGDGATIIALSDHGFCNFRRQFDLNTWLRDSGYISPAKCRSLMADPRYPVNWSSTRAYGLGLNGLYINLAGRERDGIVDPSERDALLEEITEKLLAVRDPLDGKPVIARVYRTDRVYNGPEVVNAPDLIVGYHRGFRASWATTLGEMTGEVLSDNNSAWSADHCIAAEQVPGVVFANRPILRANPTLIDLAPTILSEFDVDLPEVMRGGNIFESSAVADAAKTTGL